MRWSPVLLMLLFPALSVAWPVGGARLTGARGEQINPDVVVDGIGGAFVSWVDQRDYGSGVPPGLSNDCYLQHVMSNGAISPGWPADGLVIATGIWDQFPWRMAPDGVGGVLIVFGDTRVDFGDLYLQRITAAGAVAPGWPDGGVPLGVGPGEQFAPELAGDGAGGAFVSWQDSDRAGTSRARLSHVLGSGQLAPGWPENGRLFEPSLFQISRPLLLASGGGGFLACWAAATNASGSLVRVLAQRYGADGIASPSWSVGGLEIIPPLFSSRGPVAELVPDGAGGFFTLIEDHRPTLPGAELSAEGYYVQHVRADGVIAPDWPVDGRAVSAPLGLFEQGGSLCEDGTGGLYVSWEDYRDPAPRVYVQHIRADGSLDTGWPEGGRALEGAADEFGLSPKLAWDGMRGAFVTWMTLGASGYRSHVQHVSADGSPEAGWPAGGQPVTTLATSQYVPRIAGDGHGNAIVTWEDTRGGERDVYAQQFTHGFVVAVTASVAGVEASAERVRVRWRVAGETSARAQRREGAGEWRTLAELLADGVGEMVLEDVAVSAGSSYAYRLAFASGQYAGETSVVVPRLELALAGARPNPAVGEVWVACTLPDASPARLELYDTAGRRRASRDMAGAGEHRVRLTDGALAPGLYWAVLTHGEHSRRARVVVAR